MTACGKPVCYLKNKTVFISLTVIFWKKAISGRQQLTVNHASTVDSLLRLGVSSIVTVRKSKPMTVNDAPTVNPLLRLSVNDILTIRKSKPMVINDTLTVSSPLQLGVSSLVTVRKRNLVTVDDEPTTEKLFIQTSSNGGRTVYGPSAFALPQLPNRNAR